MTTSSLAGRTALVTGGARNLGADMARTFAAAGASVVVTSRDARDASSAADRLRDDYGIDAFGLPLDVTDPASIDAAAAELAARVDRLDILVCNAGGGSGAVTGDLFERPVEAITSLVGSNLTGTILSCRAFGRIMRERGDGGSIITIGSIAGLVGRDRRMYREGGVEQQPVDYAAAKAGVIGFTRDLAAFLAPHRIRANSISPGGFGPRTLPAAFVDAYAARTPLGRMGTDGVDICGAALFLASDASAYVTGQNLVVDGGFTAWR